MGARLLTAENFFDRCQKTDDGCWDWLGSLNQFGYGQVSWQGKSIGAHRAAHEVAKGPIPEGLHVMHTCDNRKCVNPEHLFLGTRSDNMRDMVAKGRYRGSAQPNKAPTTIYTNIAKTSAPARPKKRPMGRVKNFHPPATLPPACQKVAGDRACIRRQNHAGPCALRHQ